MFPLRDDNPTLGTSWVTFLLIGLNALVWIFVQGLGSDYPLAASICRYGLIPGELLGTAAPGTKVPLGQGLACVLAPGASGWSVVTSMFMHGGWFHIIGNMWFLAVFGDNVEDALGTRRFILFYLLCGVAAAALQVATAPESVVPMVGASGAIGGVMGAYAILFPRAPVHVLVVFGFYITRIVVPAFLMLGYWFFIQILGGIPALAGATGGIAFWAHVGGFLAGVVLAKLLCNPRRAEACRNRKGRTDRMVQRYRTPRGAVPPGSRGYPGRAAASRGWAPHRDGTAPSPRPPSVVLQGRAGPIFTPDCVPEKQSGIGYARNGQASHRMPCRRPRRQGILHREPPRFRADQKVPGYLPPSISRFCPVMKLAWVLHR